MFKMLSSDQRAPKAHQGVSSAFKTKAKKGKFSGDYIQFDFHSGGINTAITNST